MGSRCRRIALSALVAGLLGAVVTPAQAVSPEEADLLAAASAAHKRWNGFRDIEPKALAAADAERQGDTLILRLQTGPAKIYMDRPECKGTEDEAQCISYALVFHIRSYDLFVVVKQYYENSEFLLIDDRSGNETVVEGFPHYSPSGQRAAVVIGDVDRDPAVQIWRRQGSRFALDWSKAPYVVKHAFHVVYRFVSWHSEDTLALAVENTVLSEPMRTTRFALHHAAAGWQIVGSAGPKASNDPFAVERIDLVGGWRLTADGETCQFFATLTPLTTGFRAATRNCAGKPFQSIAAWTLLDSRVVLMDQIGSIVATLARTGPERFAGKTADGKAIGLGR